MAEPISIAIPHETVNDESVRILAWKAESGSRVEQDQLLCEVETSKTVLEIHAPAPGLLGYRAAVGDEVPVGSIICTIAPDTFEAPREAPAVPQPLAPSNGDGIPQPQPADQLPPARLTPLALAVSAQYGIDPASFPPGTLVRRDDVLRKAGKLPPETSPSPARSLHKETQAPSEADGRTPNTPVAGVPLAWVDLPRRKTLERRILSAGRTGSIQSSITSTCRAPELRSRIGKLGLSSVGLDALVVFEASRLLRKYPVFNAVHDRGRIGHYQDINIGWAIDGGEGLVVPVVKQADQKSFRQIAAMMEQHVEAYVGNSLAPADLLGGTFTISNLSAEGVSLFQPLISQGQSAILGVGSDIAPGGDELFYFTLAFDHQVTEGRAAARFVRELSERLETHSELDNAAAIAVDATVTEPFCILCQRDASKLLKLKAVLVKSEMPPGSVCSICLAGY